MKIVLWDVETAPLVVTSWGLFKPYLSHDNILEDSSLICAAWKTYGEKEISTAEVKISAPRNDLAVVKALRKGIANADVLVAHNGDRFDLKVFNGRLAYHGLDPLPPIKTIDTLKVARRYFRFTSNRLDYLGAFLKLGRKLPTSYDLWLDILMTKNADALATMVKYNKQDVALLEKIYNRLRPFMVNHPNQRLCDGEVCPICGAEGSLQKRGFRMTRLARSQAYQCQSCGGWSTGAVLTREKVS